MHSRYRILLETYSKALNIEGLTMVDMAKKQILPAVNTYLSRLVSTATAKQSLSPSLSCRMELSLIEKLSALEDAAYDQVGTLASVLADASKVSGELEHASYYKDRILPAMEALRKSCDEMEVNTAEAVWPFPQYGELLFMV